METQEPNIKNTFIRNQMIWEIFRISSNDDESENKVICGSFESGVKLGTPIE
jgi:hypothetical protein